MKLKDNSQIKQSILGLVSIGLKNNLISKIEAEGYNKLSVSEPLVIFELLCQKFYGLGATKLWKEHSGIMATLNVCYPTFAKFIGRKTLSAANKFGKRTLEILPFNAVILSGLAFDDNLITIEEKEMYIDLITWDALNCNDVEIDILLKVITWDYQKLKADAPNVFEYIKSNYPDYFGEIMKQYQNEVKKRML